MSSEMTDQLIKVEAHFTSGVWIQDVREHFELHNVPHT